MTPPSSPPLIGLLGAWAPLLLLAACAAPLWLPGPWVGPPAAVAALYLVPPLLARLVLLGGRPAGSVPFASAAGVRWYVLHLLQVPFLRLPLLEELLRLVPGLYQLWLNLWGSRVSLLSLWGSGAMVVDRHALHVGRGAVIGVRSLLSGHVLMAGPEGLRVVASEVVIGAGAVIGGLAAIGPGCTVGPGEVLTATERLPPFCTWRDGRRWKPGSGGAAPAEQPPEQQAGGQGGAAGDR